MPKKRLQKFQSQYIKMRSLSFRLLNHYLNILIQHTERALDILGEIGEGHYIGTSHMGVTFSTKMKYLILKFRIFWVQLVRNKI